MFNFHPSDLIVYAIGLVWGLAVVFGLMVPVATTDTPITAATTYPTTAR